MMKLRIRAPIQSLCMALLLALFANSTVFAQTQPAAPAVVERMLELLSPDRDRRTNALSQLQLHWRPDHIPMLLETIYLMHDPATAVYALSLLQAKTGQDFGYDFNRWYEWLWGREPLRHPDYAEFKSRLYRLIDPKFADYFARERTAKIRLDEVRWGGVVQDGIPPLRSPNMIDAASADYLQDSNVVFGIEINGDARAYPRRILAWHEMFVDEVGGVPVVGVYCTLCGTLILYKTIHDGVKHELGTSGFLYRSNKLMYDQATQSLWNTLWGEPVIGPLADKNISLERLYVVTTDWGEWRRRHPRTQVLSLATGHRRDYSEGAAYREYFATDELMFSVPKLDRRLANKSEVLGLIFAQAPDQPLAIAADYLQRHPLYHDVIGAVEFVVLTDPSGANRVYETHGLRFKEWDRDRSVVDENGVRWTQSESALKSADGRTLNRLPAHRAFWFGWFSAYSHTRLVY